MYSPSYSRHFYPSFYLSFNHVFQKAVFNLTLSDKYYIVVRRVIYIRIREFDSNLKVRTIKKMNQCRISSK
jgi:hypothetical protein